MMKLRPLRVERGGAHKFCLDLETEKAHKGFQHELTRPNPNTPVTSPNRYFDQALCQQLMTESGVYESTLRMGSISFGNTRIRRYPHLEPVLFARSEFKKSIKSFKLSCPMAISSMEYNPYIMDVDEESVHVHDQLMRSTAAPSRT